METHRGAWQAGLQEDSTASHGARAAMQLSLFSLGSTHPNTGRAERFRSTHRERERFQNYPEKPGLKISMRIGKFLCVLKSRLINMELPCNILIYILLLIQIAICDFIYT